MSLSDDEARSLADIERGLLDDDLVALSAALAGGVDRPEARTRRTRRMLRPDMITFLVFILVGVPAILLAATVVATPATAAVSIWLLLAAPVIVGMLGRVPRPAL